MREKATLKNGFGKREGFRRTSIQFQRVRMRLPDYKVDVGRWRILESEIVGLGASIDLRDGDSFQNFATWGGLITALGR